MICDCLDAGAVVALAVLVAAVGGVVAAFVRRS